jgi:hypothetical protein
MTWLGGWGACLGGLDVLQAERAKGKGVVQRNVLQTVKPAAGNENMRYGQPDGFNVVIWFIRTAERDRLPARL